MHPYKVLYLICSSILGFVDIVTDVLYFLSQSFEMKLIEILCFVFLFTLLICSFLIYVYVHYKVEASRKLKFLIIIIRSLELSILTELKLAHFVPVLWDIEEDPDFEFNENYRFKILNLQEIFHGIFQSFPQLVLQLTNNFLRDEWNLLGIVSLVFSSLICIKVFFVGFKLNKEPTDEKSPSYYKRLEEMDY